MKTNDQWFNLRMDATTHAKLARLVEKSQQKKSAVIRMLIHGAPIVEMPPADYHRMMMEMYHIGNSINQIAKVANTTERIDAKAFAQAIVWLRNVILEIEKTIHTRHVKLSAIEPKQAPQEERGSANDPSPEQ